jgi:DNA-binding transcriptional MerR regulator
MSTRLPTKPAPEHPIQVVARRTGLSVDVIRAWEKRYAVVTPRRSATGRRVYSDVDLARLRLLAQATLTGRTIGQVAGLSTAELTELVRAEGAAAEAPRDAATAGPPAAAAPPLVTEYLQGSLHALERFDVAAFDALLRRAVVALSAETFLDCLVVPLWSEVTERVARRALGPSHEHLALATLRRALDRVTEAATSPLAPPDLIVATPSGQPQELGALLAAATASVEGWRVIYLGPGLPAEAIAETTARVHARAVALSLGASASDRVIPRELRQLRELIPAHVPILVEGAAVTAHRGILREIGAVVAPDGAALRERLRAMGAR